MKWNTSAFISSTIEWTPTLPTRFATMSSAPILTASALPVDYSLLPALLHYYHYYCQYLSQYLIYLLATPQFCVSAYIYPSAISYLQPPTTFLPSILPLIPPPKPAPLPLWSSAGVKRSFSERWCYCELNLHYIPVMLETNLE